MNELIGKLVNEIWIDNEENDRILFVCGADNEHIFYRTEGDCCSYSWINDLIGVDTLIGHTVRTADYVQMDDVADPMADENDRHWDELVQVYKWTLTTDRGHFDLIFRNASNGYYGGSIELYSGVNKSGMVKVTGDWSA